MKGWQMGLDIVEVVLQCEEAFDVRLQDWKLEQMRTVGDLFELVCEQLQLPFGPELPQPKEAFSVRRILAPTEAWIRDIVWSRIVQICTDQLQVDRDEVRYRASFVEDLGAD